MRERGERERKRETEGASSTRRCFFPPHAAVTIPGSHALWLPPRRGLHVESLQTGPDMECAFLIECEGQGRVRICSRDTCIFSRSTWLSKRGKTSEHRRPSGLSALHWHSSRGGNCHSMLSPSCIWMTVYSSCALAPSGSQEVRWMRWMRRM